MKLHKKKRFRKKRRNRKTCKQVVFHSWIHIKKFFKGLFVVVLFLAFWGSCYYVYDKVSNQEFTVHLVVAFVICFVLSYILGYIISKMKDLGFSNVDGNGDIGDFIIGIVVVILSLLAFGVMYSGINHMIYKITGNERFKSI